MNKFLITSLEVLFISYFVSGCSLLQNRYADRSRIEEDRSTVVSTGSGQSKIEEAVKLPVMKPNRSSQWKLKPNLQNRPSKLLLL